MYIKNRIGDTGDPWGIPVFTLHLGLICRQSQAPPIYRLEKIVSIQSDHHQRLDQTSFELAVREEHGQMPLLHL